MRRALAVSVAAALDRLGGDPGAAPGDGAGGGGLRRRRDPDVLLLCVGEPPRLLRNDGGNRNHWIGVRLVGTRSGRDTIGARLAVSAGGRTQGRARLGGASYLTASDPRVLFGLGRLERVDSIEVRWPSGHVDRFPGTAADRYLTLTERQAPAPPAPGPAP